MAKSMLGNKIPVLPERPSQITAVILIVAMILYSAVILMSAIIGIASANLVAFG